MFVEGFLDRLADLVVADLMYHVKTIKLGESNCQQKGNELWKAALPVCMCVCHCAPCLDWQFGSLYCSFLHNQNNQFQKATVLHSFVVTFTDNKQHCILTGLFVLHLLPALQV